MHTYTTFCMFVSAITFLVGFGIGVIAGYHVLKSDFEDHHNYLEYLIHRQDEIRNQKGDSVMGFGIIICELVITGCVAYLGVR